MIGLAVQIVLQCSTIPGFVRGRADRRRRECQPGDRHNPLKAGVHQKAQGRHDELYCSRRTEAAVIVQQRVSLEAVTGVMVTVRTLRRNSELPRLSNG